MINVFFLINNHSGAKKYAEELVRQFRGRKDICFHEVYLFLSECNEFDIRTDSNIHTIVFPQVSGDDPDRCMKQCARLLDLHFRIDRNTIFHVNFELHMSLAGYFRERYGVKVVYTLHFLPRPSFIRFSLGNLVKRFSVGYDRIITVTDYARRLLAGHPDIDSEKIVHIYNGVSSAGLSDDDIGKLRRKWGFAQDEKVVLFVGRVTQEKGVLALAAAFDMLARIRDDVRLVVVGSGDFDDFFAVPAERKAKVVVMGRLDAQRVGELYRLADIGVIPSCYEQCSYVALEMMRAGLPAVVSDIDGLNELYRGKEMALLCPMEKDVNDDPVPDCRSMAEQMALLLDRPELAARFSNRAETEWRRFYTLERMADEIVAMYCDVLQNGG